MQLVLDTTGIAVKQRKGCFSIIGKEQQRLISPERITSIAVLCECMFSSAAIRLAVEHGIPIFFMGATGKVEGKLWSPYFVGMASLRRAQALWLETEDWIPWAKQLASLKTQRQMANLQAQAKAKKLETELEVQLVQLTDQQEEWEVNLAKMTDPDTVRGILMGMEGTMAKSYWAGIALCVPTAWRYKGRSRQPAQDPYNAALNYLYGLLYPVVEGAIFAAGLDPYQGVLHAEEYDTPALTFDCIEPFRPWVDELLIELCHEGVLDIAHFEPRDGGWWVGKKAKAVLIPRFNDFLISERKIDGENRTVRNHIHGFAGSLSDLLRDWYAKRKA